MTLTKRTLVELPTPARSRNIDLVLLSAGITLLFGVSSLSALRGNLLSTVALVSGSINALGRGGQCGKVSSLFGPREGAEGGGSCGEGELTKV